MKKQLPIYGVAMLLCSCTMQQPASTLDLLGWGEDEAYPAWLIEEMQSSSEDYKSQLRKALSHGDVISLELFSVHAENCKNATLTNRCECRIRVAHKMGDTKTIRKKVKLTRKEQETLRTLISRSRCVKNAIKPTQRMSYSGAAPVCTDAQGNRLWDAEVRIVPQSQVSDDGYALGAHLALPDDDYEIWQRITERKTPPPAQRTDAEAESQNQQAAANLHTMLKGCASIRIRGHSNVCKCAYHRDLSATESKALCSLLRRAKPLQVAGRFEGRREREMFIIFYDAEGQEIGRINASCITDADSARHATQCTAEESMYLSTRDYQRLQQFLICK